MRHFLTYSDAIKAGRLSPVPPFTCRCERVATGAMYMLEEEAMIWWDLEQHGWRAEFTSKPLIGPASIGYDIDDAVAQLHLFSYYSAKRKTNYDDRININTFGTWEHRYPMAHDNDPGRQASYQDRGMKLSTEARVQRTGPRQFVATVEMGNRTYYGLGMNADIAIADLGNSFKKLFEDGEDVQNYTVRLPNGNSVPAAWADALSLPGITREPMEGATC